MEELNEDSAAFLKKLYEIVGRNVAAKVNGERIGTTLGFHDNDTFNIVWDLEKQDLVQQVYIDGELTSYITISDLSPNN